VVKKQAINTMKKTFLRIKNAVLNYGYLQAIEKIAFTTIGLLLALWINNWNDGRKAHREERELLAEIRVGLIQDKKDIHETAYGYQLRKNGCNTILKHIFEQLPESDTLNDAFQYLHGYSFLLANTGGYETLKSKGLETIQNDSLRGRITTLYDVDYERVKEYEGYVNKIYIEQGTPKFYATLSRTERDLKAVNWQSLQKDNVFIELIQFLNYSNQQLSDEYSQLERRVSQIIGMIDKEIEN
jgi:hypothetical protein